MKKLCVVSCPIATRSGYGARSRDLVRSLIQTKGEEWDIKILPQRWGNTPQNALTTEDVDLTSRLISGNINQKPDVWMQITIPSEFQPVGHFNIGVSAVIETTDASAEFIDGCNRMDLTLVSSEHSKKTLEVVYDKINEKTKEKVGQTSLTKPVEVLFEGFDPKIYDNKSEVHQSVNDVLSNVKESFTYLFVGHWLQGNIGHDRKNVSGLIHTFLNTFKNKKNPPALILKTSITAPGITNVHELRKRIEMIKGMIDSKILPNIYILDGDLSDEEMNSLYNHPKVKAHVSFTRGEGFGRPLLEACVSGKPIITSNWSGHVDFLHSDYNFLVGGELQNVDKSAANNWIRKESKWFTINYNDAAHTLKTIYDNYKKAVEKSRKNRKYVKDNFTLDNMSSKLSEILDIYKVGDGPQQVGLTLPTLKKKDTPTELKLPKLKKVGE
jgi:glycosyltransferase involved in cell wall biosynthesis